MSAQLRTLFETSKARDHTVFVSFLTAGFPTRDSTVSLMLALQKGGTDIIELGIPFSDPIADGPAIQHSNNVRPIWRFCRPCPRIQQLS